MGIMLRDIGEVRNQGGKVVGVGLTFRGPTFFRKNSGLQFPKIYIYIYI